MNFKGISIFASGLTLILTAIFVLRLPDVVKSLPMARVFISQMAINVCDQRNELFLRSGQIRQFKGQYGEIRRRMASLRQIAARAGEKKSASVEALCEIRGNGWGNYSLNTVDQM